MSRDAPTWIQPSRRRFVFGICGLLAAALGARAADLQAVRSDFLRRQARERHVRLLPLSAHRGMLLDRNGEPLAISTPVWSIWADPTVLGEARERLPELASALEIPVEAVRTRLDGALEREFIWLRRRLTPGAAQRALSLDIPGVGKRREYRRYYPTAEVSSHVIGFTGIDDHGREGVELAYDDWLAGETGRKRVVIDRLGRTISDLGIVREARPGRDLTLSIDRRLQYLAYRELKAAVEHHRAVAGSLVILDVRTGEVLAMVNQPGFNPNDGSERSSDRLRNRAVTDTFEPGSTMKTFTIAAALQSGEYQPDTQVLTAPGTMQVGSHRIRDYRDLGELNVSGVLQKSSNVGASRIALSLSDERLWQTFTECGFGQGTGVGYPGEANGKLMPVGSWGKIEKATMAFGYGLSVTPLQLARAYAAIAGDGRLPPVTLRKDTQAGDRKRVMSPQVARAVRDMLEAAVGPQGTGQRAAITGYRVGGKTGTTRKNAADGYAADRYRAMFAGFAPASEPRLAAAVVIDEPQGEAYFGGEVAAPLFARVIGGSLRLLDIAPDAIEELRERSVRRAGEAA